MKKDSTATRSWLVGQLILMGLGALVLAGWPPRSGALMLVPLAQGAAGEMVPMAIAAHALLIGPGPLPGSYVVRGDRDTLVRAMPSGVLILSAPAAGCDAPGASA